MKAKIIHVLCEEQTEQGFVEEVLRPYLQDRGITGVKNILITTNKKKNARGGMLSYKDAERDIKLLQLTKQDNEYECHLFTTMFDLYALPDDFPGFSEASTIYDAYVRVKALEKSFSEAINEKRFVPYIQLHEFEALLFCGISYLPKLYPGCEKRCEQLTIELLVCLWEYRVSIPFFIRIGVPQYIIRYRAENETCLIAIRKLPNLDGRLGNFRFEGIYFISSTLYTANRLYFGRHHRHFLFH